MPKHYTPEGKVIHDLTIRFQVYLERLKAGQLRSADVAIRAFDKDIGKALNSMTDKASRRQIESMLKGLAKDMYATTDSFTESYMKTLREFSKYALTFNANTMNLILPPGAKAVGTISAAAAWSGILSEPIQATGTMLEPFIRSWGASTVRKVESAVRVGFAQGKTVGEITRAIRGTKAANFRDGILGGVTKREANAMVRTSLQHVNNSAQQMMYADNSDIIEGYIWISTLDNRTSSSCRSLDLQQFEVGKGPVPPIHVNCRSTTIPKIAGVDLLSETTRASADGQVPADMNYYQWLKTQSPEFQDEVLGKTRGKLFRDGGLSTDEFASAQLDRQFEPLTLAEMKTKSSGEFEQISEAQNKARTKVFAPLSASKADDMWVQDKLTKAGSLSNSVKEAISYYSLGGFVPMNSLLRTGKIAWHAGERIADVELKKLAAALAAALDKSKLAHDVELYRAVSASSLKLKVGGIYEDSGFMSFTISKEAIQDPDFLEHLGGKKTQLIRYNASAGTSGVLSVGRNSELLGEREVLRRGGKFKVVAIDDEGFYVIEFLED